MNVRVPFNFTTWNRVVYTSGYVITYIIKSTELNHLILILNLANKSHFIIKVIFCHLLALFKNFDPLKVGVNSFWDTLYIQYEMLTLCQHNDFTLFVSIMNQQLLMLSMPTYTFQYFGHILHPSEAVAGRRPTQGGALYVQ